jgi:NitT/TauT family transport system substrate-binding protein
MVPILKKYESLVILMLCLLLQSCGSPQAEKEQPKESYQLKVNAPPFLSMAPIFIAHENGYFQEEGLEIELSKFFTMEAIPALGEGRIDVAAGLIPVNALNAMARGTNIKIVADLGHLDPATCAADGFMIRSELVEKGRMDSPDGLKGLRASIEKVSIDEYMADKLLGRAGLTIDDLQLVRIPIPSELKAMGEGGVDIVPTSEPWVTRISQAGHGVLWMPFQDVIPDFQYLVIYYGPSLVNGDPGLGRRFMKAYLKGVQLYIEGKTDRNLEILTRRTGLERELLEEACWPTVAVDGGIDVPSILDFQSWAVEKGYLDTLVTEEEFWDPRFKEHARQAISKR